VDSFLEDLQGMAAMGICYSLNAPLRRAQILMQSGMQPQLRSIATLKSIVAGQGFLSLWRGNTPYLLRNVLWDTDVEYPVYDKAGLWRFGGFVLTFLCTYPLESISVRMAADLAQPSGSRRFKGIWDCYQQVEKAIGLRGVYTGFFPRLQFYMTSQIIHKALYEEARGYVPRIQGLDSPLSYGILMFLGSQFGALVSCLCTYPLYTISTRMITSSMSSPGEYQNSFESYRTILNRDGLRGLYRGLPMFLPASIIYGTLFFCRDIVRQSERIR